MRGGRPAPRDCALCLPRRLAPLRSGCGQRMQRGRAVAGGHDRRSCEPCAGYARCIACGVANGQATREFGAASGHVPKVRVPRNRDKGTENRDKGTENRSNGTEDWNKGTENRSKGTENRSKGTEDWNKGTAATCAEGRSVGRSRRSPPRRSISSMPAWLGRFPLRAAQAC
jgi:hypothetical protein